MLTFECKRMRMWGFYFIFKEYDLLRTEIYVVFFFNVHEKTQKVKVVNQSSKFKDNDI